MQRARQVVELCVLFRYPIVFRYLARSYLHIYSTSAMRCLLSFSVSLIFQSPTSSPRHRHRQRPWTLPFQRLPPPPPLPPSPPNRMIPSQFIQIRSNLMAPLTKHASDFSTCPSSNHIFFPFLVGAITHSPLHVSQMKPRFYLLLLLCTFPMSC